MFYWLVLYVSTVDIACFIPTKLCISTKSYSLPELVMERTISVLIYRVWPFTVTLVYDFGSIATDSLPQAGNESRKFFSSVFHVQTKLWLNAIGVVILPLA